MNQKQVSVLLLACLVIVSFMCYQQAKKIDKAGIPVANELLEEARTIVAINIKIEVNRS